MFGPGKSRGAAAPLADASGAPLRRTRPRVALVHRPPCLVRGLPK